MIKDVMKISDNDSNFRQVAKELNIKVEKVEKHWNDWIRNHEYGTIKMRKNLCKTVLEGSSRNQSNPVRNHVIKGEIQAKLVSPRRLILFWDSHDLPKSLIELYFNRSFEKLAHVIRIYDVSHIEFNGENANHFFDIIAPYQQGYWSVKGLLSNRNYIAEIGVKLPDGGFFPLLRSNEVQTPKLDATVHYPIYRDVFTLQQHEERGPKWTEHVSTYSYYVNTEDGGSPK
jgi:hypothetical protein